MFQLIFNILNAFCYSIWSFLLTIITGKLAKVSSYHFTHQSDNNGFFDICSDKYKTTQLAINVSDRARERIIGDFLNHLQKDPNFNNPANEVIWPIFDGKEVVGTQSYSNVIFKSLDQYLKK